MKIAILGTRGIPNNHGGFEQFAEHFSLYLAKKGHDVNVFNTHTHPYQSNNWKGVKIIHKNDPEDKIGTIGQFIYDLNCINHCRKEHFDIILQLGYTSNSIWHKRLPKKSIIITNMDGLEWKRSKYPKLIRTFLKIAERLAVKSSDYLISDSLGIQQHIKKTYNKDSFYIPYGATPFNTPNVNVIKQYGVSPHNYNMLIARMEPENNIEIILDAISLSKAKEKLLVIGKHDTNKFGAYLKRKFKHHEQIKFVGGVYDLNHLNNLRYFSRLYFHGHSVGGTNPSLLEAMASGAFIVANNNIFNKSILKKNAIYFKNKKDIIEILENQSYISNNNETFTSNNIKEIKTNFSWSHVNRQYEQYLLSKMNKN